MPFADHIARADAAVIKHLGDEAVAVYRPSEGGAFDVDGIFDENYVLVEPDRPGVEMPSPAFWAPLASFPTDPREDDPTLTIGGKDYHVRERPTDGVGGSIRLLLHRAT